MARIRGRYRLIDTYRHSCARQPAHCKWDPFSCTECNCFRENVRRSGSGIASTMENKMRTGTESCLWAKEHSPVVYGLTPVDIAQSSCFASSTRSSVDDRARIGTSTYPLSDSYLCSNLWQSHRRLSERWSHGTRSWRVTD